MGLMIKIGKNKSKIKDVPGADCDSDFPHTTIVVEERRPPGKLAACRARV